MFTVTTAVKKMLQMKAAKKVIQGATSSGKTYGIIPIIVDRCIQYPRLKATVVAESIPAVKDGAVQIFQDFMHDEGRWRDDAWLGNPMEYTFLNGSKIQFKSFDTVGKAKAAGKRDLLFINEGNHIDYPIADALMIRSKEVWIDFNADAEFWAHTEVLKEPNSEFLKLTYLDNEAIPKETLESLLYRKAKAEAEDKAGQRGYWWNWWQVYGMGEIGSLHGTVFSNWSQADFVPDGAKYIGTGLDFGFTNDPTAAVDVYQYDGAYYFDEVLYQKGMINSEISNILKGKRRLIVADSAEPKSIQDLKTYGLNVIACTKGKDSILHGIQAMQDIEMRVTTRSHNLIAELRQYTWKTDREGKATNQPIDAYNHIIDAARYLVSEKIAKKSSGTFTFG